MYTRRILLAYNLFSISVKGCIECTQVYGRFVEKPARVILYIVPSDKPEGLASGPSRVDPFCYREGPG